MLTFVGLAGFLAVVYPAFLSADEVHHLDYAWRVGHGDLPRFEDGVTAPGVPPASPQSSFQHPPLTYLVLAPVVTPLLDDGRWRAAVLAGRAVVLVMGALAVVSAGWATRRVVAEPDPVLVVTAVVVAGFLNPLIGSAAAVYNDTLAVLAGIVAMGFTATILRRGPTVGTVAAVAIANAVALASRASSAVIVLVTAAAIGVAAVRSTRGRGLARRAVASLGNAAAVVAIPLVAIGWFYARNVRLTGNWIGGQPDLAVTLLGRERRSLIDVLTDLRTWARGVGTLLGLPVDPAEDAPVLWYVAFAVVVVVAGIAVARGIRRIRRGSVDQRDYLVAGLLGVVGAGAAAQFAIHVSNAGGPNSRYFLPALLSICVGAAYGLRPGRRTRGAILILFVVTNAAMLLLQTARVLQLRRFDASVGVWDAWTRGAALNGLPGVVVPLALAVVVVGIGATAVALWRLTAPRAVGRGDPLSSLGGHEIPAEVDDDMR